MSAIWWLAHTGWFETDPALLRAVHDDCMAAQILITAGRVAPLADTVVGGCAIAWSKIGVPWSLDHIALGLTVEVEGIDSILAEAIPYVADVDTEELFRRDSLGEDDHVKLFVGNVCSGDVLDWARNSIAGRIADSDFGWVYGLSEKREISDIIVNNEKLPIPVVNGGDIDANCPPEKAFASVLGGGGGGAGCECCSCLDKPQEFDF